MLSTWGVGCAHILVRGSLSDRNAEVCGKASFWDPVVRHQEMCSFSLLSSFSPPPQGWKSLQKSRFCRITMGPSSFNLFRWAEFYSPFSLSISFAREVATVSNASFQDHCHRCFWCCRFCCHDSIGSIASFDVKSIHFWMHRWMVLSGVLVYCADAPLFDYVHPISCNQRGEKKRNESCCHNVYVTFNLLSFFMFIFYSNSIN